MASRKEYEMLFALNAQMGSGFSGAFSKAQAEFTKLGKEIQELHRLQSDIASYQKQQTAIENTRSKLENLQKQHDLLQKEINETTGSTAGLEREKLKLEQQIGNTEAALERQNQKLTATDTKLKEAGVDTGNLAGKSAELAARTKELEAEQQKAAESAQSFGNKTAAAFEAASSAIAAAGIASALREIYEAFQACVSIAADFEETMSTVKALSGANVEEMAQLNALAKELGATTKFTATEAAEAMTYMAMAGWEANEMLSGMDGVMQLAAASGENLAMVADIVTDNLTAFGLTAADAAHFSDVLAASATNSNTSVSIMGDTFKNCAAIAGALNYTIDDVAVAIGLMANAGVKGSNAGTALKNTLNGLVSGVTLTGKAFGEYEFTAVKADGTMKDFAVTVDELRECFNQMTEAEKFSNAQAIAGSRTYNGLLAILNATDEEYESLRASIQDCTGAASEMAQIKLDNLNGQLTLMNSAWDALKTTIGEQFNPVLRKMAEAATDAFAWMDKFAQEHPALVKGVGAFTVAALGAATAITTVAAAVKVLKALDLISLFTNPVFLVATAVAGLTAAVVALSAAQEPLLDESWELTAVSREQYNELQALNEEYTKACDLYGETSYEAQRLQWRIEDLSAEYEAEKETFEDYTAAMEAALESHREMVSAHEENYQELQKSSDGTLALIDRLDELSAAAEGVGAHQQEIQAIVQALNGSGLTISWEGITGDPKGAIQTVREVAEAQAAENLLAEQWNDYTDRLADKTTLKSAIDDAREQLEAGQREYDKAAAAYEEADSAYQERAAALGADVIYTSQYEEWQKAMEIMSAAEEQLESYQSQVDENTEAYDENEKKLKALEEALQEYTRTMYGGTEGWGDLSEAMAPVGEKLQALANDYNEAYTAALESIQGQYAIWDEVAPATATSIESINAALESQTSYWQNYNANLESLNERAADIEGLTEVIASFADGSTDSVNAVAGMAAANDADLRAMVSNWQELQSEQGNASESLAELQTDFQKRMEEIQQVMEDTVAGMDMPDEAEQAAANTIQAFIAEAYNQLPVVQRAYASVAQAAASGLSTGKSSSVSSTLLSSVTAGAKALGLNGYATGTMNAPRGAAIVGENGPELVYFQGGERVVPSPETAAILSNTGSSFAPTVQMNIHVDGNATSETVDKLRAWEDEIVRRTLDAIEEANLDAIRSAYR